MSDFYSGILPPDHLYIELTNRCNLACRHCYLQAGPVGKQALEVGLVEAVLSDFAEMGGVSVAFSGGEPLLYSDWKSLVRNATHSGLKTTLVTNGILLKDEDLLFLREFGATLAISIEGHRAATHDAIRGRGSFDQVRSVLDKLQDYEMQDSTTICFTPNKVNLSDLTSLAMILSQQRFWKLYISLLEERGRERLHGKQLSLDLEETVNLITQLALLLSRPNLEIEIDAGHLKYFFARLLGSWDGVGDPIEGTLRIDPFGQVYLTAYVDDDRFLLGNLHESGLQSISRSLNYRKRMVEVSERQTGLQACSCCPYWIVCGGGSPARAFAKHKNLMEPDDLCEAKRIFLDRWYRAL